MRESRSNVGLEDVEPSICYVCAHYTWHIQRDIDIHNWVISKEMFWVHECKADFEPGDEVRQCAGFLPNYD